MEKTINFTDIFKETASSFTHLFHPFVLPFPGLSSLLFPSFTFCDLRWLFVASLNRNLGQWILDLLGFSNIGFKAMYSPVLL